MERKKMYGHLAVFVANIIFGLNNPVSRSLMPDIISPFSLTFFRFTGGMLLFWIASLCIPREKVDRKDFLPILSASLFALVINQLLFFIGLSKTSPIDASIVVTMLPIITMILAAMIMKEPVTLLKVVGVLVGASGALIIIFSNSSSHVGESNFLGNLIVFTAAISFSLYLTLFKRIIQKYAAITLMKWMFLFATIVSIPFCLPHVTQESYSTFNITIYIKIAYVIVLGTFTGYLLIPIGQKELRPTTLSMYNYVQPIIASLVAIAIGIDQFGYEQALAGLLVFAGVYVVTQSKTKAQSDAEKQGSRQKLVPPSGE